MFDVRDIWPDVAIEMNSFGKNSIYSMLFNFISNRLYKCADIITTVSPGKVIKIKNKLKKEKEKVCLVENGFDDTMLNCNHDDEFSSKFKIKDYFTFCFCGKIGMAQGLDKVILLANHFRNNSNVRFIIAGDGVEKDKIKQHIEQQELKNIVFTGVVSFDQVKTILTDSSVALVPLKTKNMKDSVPTKLYESLAFGCPTLLVAAGLYDNVCIKIFFIFFSYCLTSLETGSILPSLISDLLKIFFIVKKKIFISSHKDICLK